MILSDIKGFAPLVWKGAWSAGAYPANSMVKYNNLVYVSKNSTSTLPTDTSQWDTVVPAAPSMTYFSESISLAVVIFNSKTSCKFEAKLAGEDDVHFVLYPKGIASIAMSIPTVGQKPPFTDNVRGPFSVDLKALNSGSANVTNGSYSFSCASSQNRASGEYSCSIGENAVSSGRSSSCIGGGGVIMSGECSSGIGHTAEDLGAPASFIHGGDSINSGSGNGGKQVGQFILQAESFGSTVVTMAINPSLTPPDGTIKLPINSSLIEINIILRSSGDQVASWRYSSICYKSHWTTPGSTFFSQEVLTKTFDNIAFLSVGPPTVSVTADHNNGHLKVNVGNCEGSGRWLALVKISS
jgi:hypothetical protein